MKENMNENRDERIDEMEEKFEVSKKDIMDAMMDLGLNKDSKFHELTEHSPMITLLFPIIGIELAEALAEKSRINTVADILTGANKEG